MVSSLTRSFVLAAWIVLPGAVAANADAIAITDGYHGATVGTLTPTRPTPNDSTLLESFVNLDSVAYRSDFFRGTAAAARCDLPGGSLGTPLSGAYFSLN